MNENVFQKICRQIDEHVKRAQAHRGSVKPQVIQATPRVTDYGTYIKLITTELAKLDEECTKHTRTIKTICTRAETLIRHLENHIAAQK